MDLKNMTKEELETLSYTDIAHLLLKENKKGLNTPTLFKKICDLLEFSNDEYESNIGEFYTSLTTDKRFVLLDNGEWDLRDNHSVKIAFDDEEDEEEDEENNELDDDDEMDDNEDTLEEAIDDEDIPDDSDDDMDDLAIMDDDEELEEN